MNFNHLKDFLDTMAACRTPGNAITVYLQGKKVFSYAAGCADLESRSPFTGEEYVNIYSCSKITTVTAAAQLLEKGVFLLDEPLYEYLPEYRHMAVKQPDGSLSEAKNPILIGDLFSMTAGFHYNCSCPSIKKAGELTGGRYDTAEVARQLAKEPLSFEPGTHWQYSLCHDVLAGLISVLTDMPFREYVKRNIFEPLDMTKSVYHHTPEIEEKMASQYSFVPDGADGGFDLVEAQKQGRSGKGRFVNVGKGVSHIFGPEYDSGGAGITTTMDDYVKLMAALAGKGTGLTGERILSPKTVELMRVNRLNEQQMKDFNWTSLRGYGYGLGVRTHLSQAGSGLLAGLGEFGWNGAAGASAIIDAELGLGVFYVQHCLNPREEWYQPRLRNVVYGCL